MKKFVYVAALFLAAGFTTQAAAQDGPMLSRGTQELGVSGNIDFEDPDGNTLIDLGGSYGYFIQENTEVGVSAGYSRRSGGDVEEFALGGFGELHFPRVLNLPYAVSYVGATLDFQYTDLNQSEDNDAIVLTPRIGVKWFLRDHFAIDTNLFVNWATDEIYVNDGESNDTDWGLRAGLRVYFQ